MRRQSWAIPQCPESCLRPLALALHNSYLFFCPDIRFLSQALIFFHLPASCLSSSREEEVPPRSSKACIALLYIDCLLTWRCIATFTRESCCFEASARHQSLHMLSYLKRAVCIVCIKLDAASVETRKEKTEQDGHWHRPKTAQLQRLASPHIWKMWR